MIKKINHAILIISFLVNVYFTIHLMKGRSKSIGENLIIILFYMWMSVPLAGLWGMNRRAAKSVPASLLVLLAGLTILGGGLIY